jgi:hypothetical protein
MATGSPAWRITSPASNGISVATNSSRWSTGRNPGTPSRSEGVMTLATPGISRASSVEMFSTRAAPNGERAKAA